MAAGTVERFTDAGSLFKVRLDILGATPAARQGGAVFPHPRPEHARARLGRRQAASWLKTPGEPAARRTRKPTEPVSAPPSDEGASEAARKTSGTAEAGVAEPSEGFFVRTRADLRRIEAPPLRTVIWSTR